MRPWIDVWVISPEDGREHGAVYYGKTVDEAITAFLNEFPKYAGMMVYAKEI